MHLLVEADDADALSRGARALQIRIARALNRLTGRTGRAFGDRYHAHVLKTPRKTRQALAYVWLNVRKHAASAGAAVVRGWDPCSSALFFDGWKDHVPRSLDAAPVAGARSWLLRVGWRRHGLIALDELPRLR